jgi:hypothetical protein
MRERREKEREREKKNVALGCLVPAGFCPPHRKITQQKSNKKKSNNQ